MLLVRLCIMYILIEEDVYYCYIFYQTLYNIILPAIRWE